MFGRSKMGMCYDTCSRHTYCMCDEFLFLGKIKVFWLFSFWNKGSKTPDPPTGLVQSINDTLMLHSFQLKCLMLMCLRFSWVYITITRCSDALLTYTLFWCIVVLFQVLHNAFRQREDILPVIFLYARLEMLRLWIVIMHMESRIPISKGVAIGCWIREFITSLLLHLLSVLSFMP